jgi:hypothetical protein
MKFLGKALVVFIVVSLSALIAYSLTLCRQIIMKIIKKDYMGVCVWQSAGLHLTCGQ